MDSTCPSCPIGRQDFCYSGRFTERGIKERDGYMTQMVVDEEQFLVRVPRELSHLAVLVEPLTIAEKALLQVWQVQQRLPWSCPHAPDHKPGACHHAVVLGAGPIGMLGAMAFRNAGFTTYVYSREPEDSDRADLVRAFDAHYISSERTPIGNLMERVGTIDVVYEATGASRLSFETLTQLGPNAAFIFTGVPGLKGKTEIDADLIMRNMVLRNQALFGTVNAGRDAFEAAIRDLGEFRMRWPGVTERLITARHGLDGYRDALGAKDGIKHVITFN
jgi:threonine dehydrogenase-like Zn-dependent dehydrogenase